MQKREPLVDRDAILTLAHAELEFLDLVAELQWCPRPSDDPDLEDVSEV